MSLTVGSLCTGTGALERGLAQVLDVEPLWFADPDPAAAALLEHRYPNVPNLGDLTAVDWRAIRRPDIVTMGFPCQDISLAGLRAGMQAGNRSGLWFHIAEILDELRPGLVVIENVRSLLTARGAAPTPELIAAWAERDRYARVLDLIDAKLDRARERAQRDRFQRLTADRVRIMGRHRRAVAAGQRADARIIRAIGAVLGDLADLGFDAEWSMLPASGVGAPHQRQRVFLVAAADARGEASEIGDRPERPGPDGWAGHRPGLGDGAATRAPAPRFVADAEGERRGEGWPEPIGEGEARAGGDRGVDDLADWAELDWADYAPAIARWERVLGRAAPAPTVLGARCARQLSPHFVQWLMGLPDGWVTGVPGLTRNQQLKLMGNGIVPAQCAAALRLLLPRLADVEAVA